MISVIVPNYNHGKYLEKRLSSIFSQTFTDYEVVILDDSSSDNSSLIIDEYSDVKKVSKIIINKKNSGSAFKQWIKGLEFCKGEYIWIAESDDYADEKFLKILVNILNANPKVDIAYSDARIVDENNDHIDLWSARKNKKFYSEAWSTSGFNSGEDEINKHLIYGTTINNISATLIRKSAITPKMKDDLITFKYAGDWYLYLSILAKGDVYYDSRPLSFYREHNMNTTKNSLANGNQFEEMIMAFQLFIKTNKNFEYNKDGLVNYFKYKFFSSLKLMKLDSFSKFKWVIKLILQNPKIMLKILNKYIQHKVFNYEK